MTSWRPAGPQHADRVSPRHIGGAYVEAPRWAGLPLPRSCVLLSHLPGSSSAPVSAPFAVRSGGRANPAGLLPSGQHPDPPRHPVGEGRRDHLLRLAFRHPFQCASHVLFSIPRVGRMTCGTPTEPCREGPRSRSHPFSRNGAAPGSARAPSRSTWVWNGNSDPPEPRTPRSRWRMSMPRQRGLLPSGPTSSGTERSRTSVASTFTVPRATARNSCSRSHRQATAARPDCHAIRVAWPPAIHCGAGGPEADLPDEADGRPGPWADADPLWQRGSAQGPLTGPRPGLNTLRQAD